MRETAASGKIRRPSMERKRKTPGGRIRPAGQKRKGVAKIRPQRSLEPAPDLLTVQAMEGNEAAFLALVRFHSTFNPVPLTPELLLVSGLDIVTRERLAGRLKRKEDRLLRPFPSIDMVFWGEEWVQKTLDRFVWRKRSGKKVPNGAFLRKLWEASSEGAMLQLRIYRKAAVTPSAWVRVKYLHFANLGLTDIQMLKIARAEGCKFEEPEFLAAVRRFTRRNPLSVSSRTAPPR
jgi:hypothetical protein